MATKRSIDSSLAIGKSMARAVLARRASAARTRRRALTALAASRVRKGKGFLSAPATAALATAGVLIAEGDSWFDYPFHDVLSELEDGHGYDVETVSHRGDTVEDMAYSGGQLDEFARRVEKVLRTGSPPRAILLSGGGNDIAGDEFAILLNHAASGIAGFNERIVTGVIDERLFDAYATILGAIGAVCVQIIGRVVPIVVHGYDRAVPDGRGFLGGWGPLPGPWLRPGLYRKGYASDAQNLALVGTLIDRFNAMLQRVTKDPRFRHVRYLDLRGTLPNGAGYKTWWANELHPTRKGFERVAEKFAAAIAGL